MNRRSNGLAEDPSAIVSAQTYDLIDDTGRRIFSTPKPTPKDEFGRHLYSPPAAISSAGRPTENRAISHPEIFLSVEFPPPRLPS
jgi:hypothetical protein